ncbi:hypothetical protein NF27_IR00010, partial [Candidatus Jidaibacter acanthamoeba]
MNALEYSNGELNMSVAEALVKVGAGHVDIVVPALINALEYSNGELNMNVAEALVKVGAGHGDIVVP